MPGAQGARACGAKHHLRRLLFILSTRGAEEYTLKIFKDCSSKEKESTQLDIKTYSKSKTETI